MRIVAGKYRRRKLQSNPGRTTRPITDRVKEILFERLGGELDGERVADVFSGTGTIGLEALSRGASSVVFIENDRKAVDLLRQNVSMLEADDVTLCWPTDVLRCSFRPKNVDHLLPFDLVFFDPPYKMIADIQPGSKLSASLERLARDNVTSPDALLILRASEGEEFTAPDCWTPRRKLTLSRMDIHIFDKHPPDNDSPDSDLPETNH